MLEDFNFNEWPIRIFKSYDSLRKKYFARVRENDLLIVNKEYTITEEIAEKYFEDGLYGYIALENKLTCLV